MRDKIIGRGILDVAIENVQSMSNDEYALVRKNGFGASDSSILCEVNLYKTMQQLITEKNAKYLTQKEKEVGEKPIVKKGYDLEPIILNKAEEQLKITIHKPNDMFKFKGVDGLTVNYDGVLELEDGILIPIEAKLVSKYGEKYYNKSISEAVAKTIDVTVEGTDLASHIKRKALKLGIPAYYYTQVQQEIMGLNAPYGYLAVLFDDSWTFKLYLVKADNYVQNKIIDIATKNKDVIKKNSQ